MAEPRYVAGRSIGELLAEAEALLPELTPDRAWRIAAEKGVQVYAEPLLVERGVDVYLGYAWAYVKFYLPYYIVEVRKYTDGDVRVIVKPAVDNSCSCEG